MRYIRTEWVLPSGELKSMIVVPRREFDRERSFGFHVEFDFGY